MVAKNAQPIFTKGQLLAQEKSQMSTCRSKKKAKIFMKDTFYSSLHFDCQSDDEAGNQNPVRNVWQIRGC